jgi:DNA adenine methylase
MTPRRPAFRWHGGKWLLAPWIISHMPAHKVYVEPFGGAASVLLRKPRSCAEIYNDLDQAVVTLFRVLRSPDAERLISALNLTPFARAEFELAYEPTDDPVEHARRLVARSFMGFGSAHTNGSRTSFRASSTRNGGTPSTEWQNVPENLRMVADRFRGVTIENRPAANVMAQHDAPATLHFLDPPYMPETRSKKMHRRGGLYHAYAHEMSETDHAQLLAHARDLRGMVMLCGYPHPLYDDALAGWKRIERPALADGARPRTEVLWLNPAACQHTLFGSAA